MRVLIVAILITGLVFAALPAYAQLGDVVMQPNDVRLLLLNNDGSQLLIRFTPTAGETAWFLLHTTPELSLQAQLLNLRGEAIEGLQQTMDTGVISVSAPISEDGDHFLRLTANDGSAAGYLRVEYQISEPNAARPAGELTFLKDSIESTFVETFADNSRNWWVGDTTNTTSSITAEALLMTLSGAGHTMSGFTAVAGSEQSEYYTTATVNLAPEMGDATFGLMVRLLDPVNFYLLQIAPKTGQWRFELLNEGQWSTIFDWQADDRLKDAEGSHTLGVWVLGDTYIPLWDGQPLGHLHDGTLSAGGVGVYAEMPPNGGGQSVIAWENIKLGVEPTDEQWGAPALPRAAQLTDHSALIFTEQGAQTLDILLIGEWFWNDADTSMTLIFSADGNFTQQLASTQQGGQSSEQKGRWYLDSATELVIQLEGLPEQRYHPTLDPTTTTMAVPELGNRTFVRIPPETSE